MLGVIGTYNSGCAAEEIPILNKRRRLAMISPGNTAVCLTESSPTARTASPRASTRPGSETTPGSSRTTPSRARRWPSSRSSRGSRAPTSSTRPTTRRARPGDELPRRRRRRWASKVAGFETWDAEGERLHRAVREGEAKRRRRRGAGRPDRGERRAGDQGQGRRCSARTTKRASLIALRRLRPAVDDRPRRRGRERACSRACRGGRRRA